MLLRPCKQCGKSMKVPPTKERSKFFCDAACRRSYTYIIATCLHCGVQYEGLRVRQERSNYCSKACSARGIGTARILPPQTVVCSICGISFETVGSRKLAHKTCSPACANKARGLNDRLSKKVQAVCAECGLVFDVFPSRMKEHKYCSRKCQGSATSRNNQGILRTSIVMECLYCGRSVKRFQSRLKETPRTFCDNACYHAWDALYKSTPEMLTRLADRMRENFGKPSKLEDRVATWLDIHGLSYERQSTLKVYSMDFKINNIYVEVQGCYWHGCPDCSPLYTPRQRKQQAKDRSKATYCRKRGIPLYTIWEHDIDRGDFSALHALLQHSTTDP